MTIAPWAQAYEDQYGHRPEDRYENEIARAFRFGWEAAKREIPAHERRRIIDAIERMGAGW